MRYLFQRSSSGIWYFRYQIPARFRSFFPYGREIKKSLSTRSLTTAKLRASRLQQVVWERMELLEKHSSDGRKMRSALPNHSSLDDAYISKYLNTIKRQTLSKLTTYIQLLERKPNLLRAQKQRIELREKDSDTPSIEIIESIYPRDANPIDIAEEMVSLDDHAFDLDTLHYREDKKNIHIAMGQFYRDFQRCLDSLYLEGARAVLKEIEEYESGTSQPLPDDFDIGASWLSQEQVDEHNTETLQPSERIELQVQPSAESKLVVDIETVLKGYEQELINNKKSQKHIKAIMRSCRLAHDILESPDMASVSRDDANRVLAQLKLFPKNANNGKQRAHFLGLSANEIIEKNESLKFDVRKSDQSLVDMGNVSTVYRWAIRHKKISYNPFEGLGGSKSKTKKKVLGNTNGDKQKKLPFTKVDLKEIFSHPVYTQGKIGRNTRDNIRLNYQYWVALIELTIGARPNEICQLRVEDVKPHEGILCFWIQEDDEDQSVKNENAVRYVPVPDVLLRLGFQSYLDSVSDERMLFPDLTYTKKAGYYGKVESWFTRNFTEPMNLTDQKKSFYSMRHSFIGFFQERRENCLVLRRLVGHENDTITDNVYGGDVPIKLLQEKINQYDVSDILEGVLPFKVSTY